MNECKHKWEKIDSHFSEEIYKCSKCDEVKKRTKYVWIAENGGWTGV